MCEKRKELTDLTLQKQPTLEMQHVDDAMLNLESNFMQNTVVTSTPHTNPGWLDVFRRDFQDIIVNKSSEATRIAILHDQDIQVG